MGIQGLLPNLASITRAVHLRDFANLRIGVDAYVWLHKATYCCSYELCNNIPTDKYIQYCLKWVRMLQSFNIIPILVFDGGHLPVKGDKEIERRTRREEYKKKAAECMSKGDKRGAYEHYQKCVDVTPKMAFNLIKALQMMNVQYIVSPYEADAQLAYLARNNMVDAVITEDSDLIPYGASRIIFKLDKLGNGKELRLADLSEVKELDFSTFTRDMLRHMCILSGCDYAGSISGIGVKKAHALLKKHRDIEKVFKAIKLDKALTMPKDYETAFKRADLTFLHQRVYDPVQRKIVTLTPLPDDLIDPEQDWSFLGPELPDDVGRRIAEGILNPSTKQPFENDTPTYNPNRLSASKKVVGKEVKIYAQKRRAMTSSAKNTPVAQKNTISNYFGTKSTSSLNVSLNNSVSQSEDNSVFDEESNDSGYLPNMAKSTASMDYFGDDDFANVDLDALFENSLGSGNNNSNSNHSTEPQSSVNNEEEVKEEKDARQDLILAPATPSPKKKVFIVRSKYFDPTSSQGTPKMDESTDLLLKSLSKSRDVDQDDIFSSLDEEDKIAEDNDFETPKNRSTERMMRDMNKPLTSTPSIARNLNMEFLKIDKSTDNSDGSLSPMGSEDVFVDEKGAKKSPFFQVPLKPFSSPLVKSTGRLSLRTTQTIKSSSVVTKVITDKEEIEAVDTKITLTKSSSASIFRMKDDSDQDLQENSAKNSAGENSENNSEDKHNKSDDNLFESVSKELNNNSNGSTNNNNDSHDNNNNENSANSLDDFDVKPPNPKQRDLPQESSSSVDSDKENSPVVVESKKPSLFEKLNLNRFSFKRKDREGDLEEQPLTKKLKTSSSSVTSRMTFVNSSSSAIVIDD